MLLDCCELVGPSWVHLKDFGWNAKVAWARIGAGRGEMTVVLFQKTTSISAVRNIAYQSVPVNDDEEEEEEGRRGSREVDLS